MTYFATEDVPVLLLNLVSKGQRSDLSKAEQNAIRRFGKDYAAAYRASARRLAATSRRMR